MVANDLTKLSFFWAFRIRFILASRGQIEMFEKAFFTQFPKYGNLKEIKLLEISLVPSGSFEKNGNALKIMRLLAKERGTNVLADGFIGALAPFQARPWEYRFTNVTCACVSNLGWMWMNPCFK